MRLGISLIEVDYGKFYENVVKKLVSNGIKNIHVDFCEKNFSGRRIIPFNKIEFIKNIKKKDIMVDFHIMAYHESNNGSLEKISKKISNYKFTSSILFFHLKAFKTTINLKNFLDKLNKLKLHPGLVIEIDQDFDKNFELLIKKNLFNTFLIMGYKEGAGGKKFNPECYNNYKKLKKLISKYKIKKYNIQFDGGLNNMNIKTFKKLKFNQVNGWSIIKSEKIFEVIEKYNSLKKILN